MRYTAMCLVLVYLMHMATLIHLCSLCLVNGNGCYSAELSVQLLLCMSGCDMAWLSLTICNRWLTGLTYVLYCSSSAVVGARRMGQLLYRRPGP